MVLQALSLPPSMMERTQFGSLVERSLTDLSMAEFEVRELPSGSVFLCSSDGRNHESTWTFELSLITYCEGDVIKTKSPNLAVFLKEQQRYKDFAEN